MPLCLLRRLLAAVLPLALLAACASPILSGRTSSGARAETGRSVTDLTRGWEFLFAGPSRDRPQPADPRWQRVDLPHSWNALGEYRVEPSGPSRKEQGVGWYRRSLDASLLPPGKRHFLQFDGVGNVADLWVNGTHVGRHAGAFSRFRVDVTAALRPGANLIEVRADNSKPAPGSSTEHVIPLLGDFFIHGGLYRGVSLVSAAPQHIDLLDHGGPGVYARTLSVGEDGAEVSVKSRLRNTAAAGRTLTLVTNILDRDGLVRARSRTRVALPAGAAATETHAMMLPRPRLWDGRADPYLYSVSVELRDASRVLDRVVQPLGIRTFHVDPDRGFFLNGRHLPLRGVSRHQDWLGKGWAIGREDHARDMALIAEMGANSVRFAHYQHAETWFEEADRAGMAVWAELPFVNKVSFGDAAAAPELVANARKQLIELIRQNYNHPSVVTWGIGNEVDIDLAFGRLGPKADARPLLGELHALAREEDPDRPTAIADCCEDTPGEKVAYLPLLTGIADLMGYNRYFGWYYGAPGDLGPHLDSLHAKHPSTPISVSEYGAGGATSQHTDNPRGGPINTSGRPHPEEFQSWWHEQSWPQLARRPYLWGNWIWNMFDFSSPIRHEGDASDINDKGLVTFDRSIRKDAFFFYKAQWSSEPVVHITGRRYVDRAYPVTDVRIYSNAGSVDVTLNGRPVGSARCSNGICVLGNLALANGQNRIAARAEFNGAAVTDEVLWIAPRSSEGLAINVGDLAGFVGKDGRRVGSDNWFQGGTPKRLGKRQADRLQGAGDRRLRIGYREGRFSYAIPVPDGRWCVTLLFLEPNEKAEPRSFDVVLNGRPVLQSFDPAAAAASPLRAIEKSFPSEIGNGRLDLQFNPRRGAAVLSGIEVRPPDCPGSRR